MSEEQGWTPLPDGDDLTGFRIGEWLQGNGPESDIAVCTRVRMARNVRGYRFATTMSDQEARELTTFVNQQLTGPHVDEHLTIVDLQAMEELERDVLVERHLISRDHAHSKRSRSVAVNDSESISVMINEEDHLRAQVFASGLQLEGVYKRAEALDEDLMNRMPLAFSEEFGFLTSCPTNTGTGMRVSVMLHLPGLVWAEEIEKATHSAQKIFLAVRGLYGEGSRALGDFYQVSNQVTLGRSEEQILDDVQTAVQRMIQWEREVRVALLRGASEPRTLDRIYRALGTLERARILSSEEALNCLSAVRMGIQQGLIDHIRLEAVNRSLLLSQPAHLQRYTKQRLDPAQRDLCRAELIRKCLSAAP